MSLMNTPVKNFTEMLASKTSVPGGGGASALVGAVAIALGDMVGEFTVGKKRYADVEEDMLALMARAQEIRESLLVCIEDDAEAFEPLSKAYGIPKEDPKRDAVMEQCLQDAAAVPFRILQLCCEAVELEQAFAEKGSKIVLSDAACGAAMCRAAILGAAVNVKINTKSMKDRDFAKKLEKSVDKLVKKYTALADSVYDSIYSQY